MIGWSIAVKPCHGNMRVLLTKIYRPMIINGMVIRVPYCENTFAILKKALSLNWNHVLHKLLWRNEPGMVVHLGNSSFLDIRHTVWYSGPEKKERWSSWHIAEAVCFRSNNKQWIPGEEKDTGEWTANLRSLTNINGEIGNNRQFSVINWKYEALYGRLYRIKTAIKKCLIGT